MIKKMIYLTPEMIAEFEELSKLDGRRWAEIARAILAEGLKKNRRKNNENRNSGQSEKNG